MTYPKVDRSHIVPQTYLRNFAINDQLAMRLVGESGSKTVNVRDAAVRRAFYRRQRPDGTDIDDIEWSLSHIESAVTTLLRGLHPAWPLDLEKKASLAEFVAVQILRGPRWQEWHSEFVPSAIAEQRADGLPGLDGVAEVVAGDNILSKFEKKIREPTYRYTRMLSLVPKVASILASMGWTLLTFRRPQLVTSDHPVVVWPLRCSAAKPRHLGFAAGILETLEIRIPISPTLALLMTWREEDASDPVGERSTTSALSTRSPSPMRSASGSIGPASARLSGQVASPRSAPKSIPGTPRSRRRTRPYAPRLPAGCSLGWARTSTRASRWCG